MKKIVTLAMFVILTGITFGQKIDYDTDSKWYLGFNVGGTWNSTDVKNKTHAGWGLILGRSFNYNYGKVFSYDLRLRYLGGNWYGQDYDTSGLSDYNTAENEVYMPENLQLYKDNPGYVVRNFNATAHELGLELAIHLNRLRERSGWNPYIFGGAGFAWNQTYGDLLQTDTLFSTTGQYDYTSNPSKSEINALLDEQFETPLNKGSENLGWNVDVVPSLGIGLRYQIGPRFSLGLEHRTMFSMKDDWDGYVDPSTTNNYLANDMYHYTSLYMKFNIRAKGTRSSADPIPDNTNGNNNLTPGGCENPTIAFITPTSSNITVDQQLFTVRAKVERIANRDHLVFKVNGQQSTNFFYNDSTKAFEASVMLISGQNTITIAATNGCGTSTMESVIQYNPCLPPTIAFVDPTNNMTVNQTTYVVRATLSAGATGIVFSHNGLNNTNFFYNASTGSFESNVALINGTNTFKISATNACGTTTESVSLTYANCNTPNIVFSTANGLIVSNAQFNVQATIAHVLASTDINLRLNGSNKTFNYNTQQKKLDASLTLSPGNNTIQVTAANACGTDTKSIVVTYVPCQAPTMSVIDPINGSAITGSQTYVVKVSVQNVSAINQLSVKVNGTLVSAPLFNVSTGIVEKQVTLSDGTNTVRITAITDCGTIYKEVTIIKQRNVNTPTPPVEEEKITICHYPPGNTGNPQTLTIPLSAWPAHQAHGDVLGPCPQTPVTPTPPVEEEKITICHYPPGNTGNPQTLTIPLSAWPAHQAHGDVLGPCPQTPVTPTPPVEEEKITICHHPPGNTGNPQTLTIPLSAWPAHQAHGDVLGPCPQTPVTPTPPVEEEKITICHYPPGNTGNPQTLTIPLSAWPAHQAHGDVLGPCPQNPVTPTPPVEEEKITICHYPPGNTGNPQTLTIPLSAWPAHQAHGDVLGPCPQNPVTPTPPVEEEKITICHHPPGNTGNPQTLTIPLSGRPAHQAHGDVLGPCPQTPVTPTPPVEEEKITICHYPPGNTGNPQTLTIPLSAWPAHQAHGDVLGPCPQEGGNENNNGNNGHGNNEDGIDSSNPGNGGGGPNGEDDPSGGVDDEGKNKPANDKKGKPTGQIGKPDLNKEKEGE